MSHDPDNQCCTILTGLLKIEKKKHKNVLDGKIRSVYFCSLVILTPCKLTIFFKFYKSFIFKGKQKNLVNLQHCITSDHLIIELQLTVFENHRKSLIQHCERSELRLHFEWTKVD